MRLLALREIAGARDVLALGLLLAAWYVGRRWERAQAEIAAERARAAIAESELQAARAQAAADRLVAEASSPENTSARAKAKQGDFASISPEEQESRELFFAAYVVMAENHHYQYEAGFLPEDHWARNLAELRCAFTDPMNRELIANWKFRASFQAVLNDVIAHAESHPGAC